MAKDQNEHYNKLHLKLNDMKVDSFAGWSEDSINGYLTAVKTIEEFLKQH